MESTGDFETECMQDKYEAEQVAKKEAIRKETKAKIEEIKKLGVFESSCIAKTHNVEQGAKERMHAAEQKAKFIAIESESTLRKELMLEEHRLRMQLLRSESLARRGMTEEVDRDGGLSEDLSGMPMGTRNVTKSQRR